LWRTYFTWATEKAQEQLSVQSLRTGYIIESFVLVCDAAGWSPSSVGEAEANVLRDIVDCAKRFYPERLGAFLVVNAPPVAAFALRALGLAPDGGGDGSDDASGGGTSGSGKGWKAPMAAAPAAKIRMVATSELLEIVPADQLPPELGGTGMPLPPPPVALWALEALTEPAADAAAGAAGVKPISASAGAGASATPPTAATTAVPETEVAAMAQGSRPEDSKRSDGSGGGDASVGIVLTAERAIIMLAVLWTLVLFSAIVTQALLAAAIACLIGHIFLRRRARRPKLAAASTGGNSGRNGAGHAAALPSREAGSAGDGGVAGAGHNGAAGRDRAAAAALDPRAERKGSLHRAEARVTELRGSGSCGGFNICSIRVRRRTNRTGGDDGGGGGGGGGRSSPIDGAGKNGGGAALQWAEQRQVLEFVALRTALVERGLLDGGGGAANDVQKRLSGSRRGSSGGGSGGGGGLAGSTALDDRAWDLPPTLPLESLVEAFQTFLRHVLDSSDMCDLRETREFFGAAPLETVVVLPLSCHAAARRSGVPLEAAAGLAASSGGGGGGGAVVGGITVNGASSRVGAGGGDGTGAGGGGGSKVERGVEGPQRLPSVRPELRDMFLDAAHTHLFRLPVREENVWLARHLHPAGDRRPVSGHGSHDGGGGTSPLTNRSSRSSSRTSTPSPSKVARRFSPSRFGRGSGRNSGVGSSGASLAEAEAAAAAAAAAGTVSLAPTATLLPLSRPTNFECPGSGVSPSSAGSDVLGGPELTPRKRQLVSKLVGHVKDKVRRSSDKSMTWTPAAFPLLHVDVFAVPHDNPLCRIDGIAAVPGGKAAARVAALAATAADRHADGGGGGSVSSGRDGSGGGSVGGYGQFVLVVNVQVPRGGGGGGARRAASVVLYWGIPSHLLAPPADDDDGAPLDNGSAAAAANGPAAGPASGSAAAAAVAATGPTAAAATGPTAAAAGLVSLDALQQDLLRRFVDLPGSGDGGIECGGDGDTYDEDERESGILPDGDFRNASFQVVAGVIEGSPMAKKAVGEGVALHLPRKVTHRFFRGRRHFEIDIDVSSAVAAESTIGVLLSQPRLTVDFGVHLAGFRRLLGCARVRLPDLRAAEPFLLAPGEVLGLGGGGFGGFPAGPSSNGGASRGCGGGGGAKGSPPPSSAAAAAELVPLCRLELAGMFADSGPLPPFKMPGTGYLSGRRRVDVGPALGRLLRADLYRVDNCHDAMWRADHIVRRGRARDVIAKLLRDHPGCLGRGNGGGGADQVLWVVNLQTPGTPPLSLVCYFLVPLHEAEGRAGAANAAAAELLRRYVDLPDWDDMVHRPADADAAVA
ncbi:unnamed protein product, partial [Phaeothamnion confervicola]